MQINISKNKLISLGTGALSVLLIIIFWEVLSRLSLINQALLPSPYNIIKTIYKEFVNGELMSDSGQSVKRVIIGFAIGSSLGLLFGLTAALKKQVGNAIRPIVEFIRPIPPLAWIPLSVLWFGLGESSAYFLISLGAFFPVFSNSFLGISLVERGTVEVAECHGASKRLLFYKIILPQSLPSIFTGLRTGLGVAWMIVITAELTGVQSGLGYYIQLSRVQLNGEQVLAGMVIIGVIGYILDYIMKVISKRLMPWRGRGKEIGYGE